MITQSESARQKEKNNREASSNGKPGGGRNQQQQQQQPHSFLTQRSVDPDGYPRNGGGGGSGTTVRARGLAEILGDDLIFAELHRGFVGLLQVLGRKYGGNMK